jgi:hypothetical protein
MHSSINEQLYGQTDAMELTPSDGSSNYKNKSPIPLGNQHV